MPAQDISADRHRPAIRAVSASPSNFENPGCSKACNRDGIAVRLLDDVIDGWLRHSGLFEYVTEELSLQGRMIMTLEWPAGIRERPSHSTAPWRSVRALGLTRPHRDERKPYRVHSHDETALPYGLTLCRSDPVSLDRLRQAGRFEGDAP